MGKGEARDLPQNQQPIIPDKGLSSIQIWLWSFLAVGGVVLCLGSVFGLLVLILWASMPYEPKLPEIRVVSAAVSPCPLIPTPSDSSCSSSNYHLTATWNLTVDITNPNRRNYDLLYYESRHQAFLLYGAKDDREKVMLAAAALPLLRLAKMEKTTLNITLSMVRAYVPDDMAKELLSECPESGGSCYGSARLGVRLYGGLAYVPPYSSDWAADVFCDLFTANINGSLCCDDVPWTRYKC